MLTNLDFFICSKTHVNICKLIHTGYHRIKEKTSLICEKPSDFNSREAPTQKQNPESLLVLYLVVVLPTPPLPPTNTHFSVFCSMILARLGSKGWSKSPRVSSATSSAILFCYNLVYQLDIAYISEIPRPSCWCLGYKLKDIYIRNVN